jgi:serine/threonine-protein kinase
VDARADVYACGVMLYQMLCGKLPYKGETVASLFFEILSGKAPRLETQGKSLPQGLADVVHYAMAPERRRRWASASELLAALEPFKSPGGGTSPMFGAPGKAPPVPTDETDEFATADTRSSWSMSDSLAHTALPGTKPRRGLYVGLAIAGLVIVAGAAIAIALPLMKGSAEEDTSGTEVAAATGGAEQEEEEKPGTPPDKVKVTINGLPEGGSIFLGDEDLGNPATLAYGTETLGLTVKAEGYRDETVWVKPDTDIEMSLTLKEAKKGGKRGKGKEKPGEAAPPTAPPEPVPAPPPPPVEKKPPEKAPPVEEKPAKKKKKLKLDLDYDKSKEREAK